MEFPFPMSHRVCRRAPLSLKVRRSKPLNQLRETKTHMLCMQIDFVLPWLKNLKVLFFL